VIKSDQKLIKSGLLNLAIQQHSAVSPKRKPVTCLRAMQPKKKVCTRVRRPDYRTFLLV
jgi:hypothetical protein